MAQWHTHTHSSIEIDDAMADDEKHTISYKKTNVCVCVYLCAAHNFRKSVQRKR